MNIKLNPFLTILKIKLKEFFLSLGFFVSLSLGVAVIVILVYGFVKSVDSSGLDFMKHPIYFTIGRIISNGFGMTFLLNIFSEGPFLFALCIAFIPLLLFISVFSIYRTGYEKKNGFIQLLLFGPSSFSTYIIAVFLRDCLIYLVNLNP